MFTGIIETTGKIAGIRPDKGKRNFSICKPAIFDDLKIGSSVACDGICLTVIGFDPKYFTVEIMNETLEKTTAKNWTIGDTLNLERALKLNSRLDGHLVQGHIDRTLRLLTLLNIKGTNYLRLEMPHKERNLMAPQGSIALNGVSLTIADIYSNYFSVALIGHTIEHTNLSSLKPGNFVNVEFDVIGKYIMNSKDMYNEIK
ncbi:MAG: riboflavin synthase [Candidatus Cloacimonas sp.]